MNGLVRGSKLFAKLGLGPAPDVRHPKFVAAPLHKAMIANDASEHRGMSETCQAKSAQPGGAAYIWGGASYKSMRTNAAATDQGMRWPSALVSSTSSDVASAS